MLRTKEEREDKPYTYWDQRAALLRLISIAKNFTRDNEDLSQCEDILTEALEELQELQERRVIQFAVGGEIQDGCMPSIMCDGPGPELYFIPEGATVVWDRNSNHPLWKP